MHSLIAIKPKVLLKKFIKKKKHNYSDFSRFSYDTGI